jgi:MSHA biogenesis protein MshG
VIGEVRESLEGGRELSQALARHPESFLAVLLLDGARWRSDRHARRIFLRLFEHLEFERYMREQVKSALRYPMFVVMAMAAAIVVVNLFVIPAFAKVFAGFGAELPLMTKILLGFSNFMVAYWPAMLVGGDRRHFAFRTWVGTTRGRYQWDRLRCAFRLPARSCTRPRWHAFHAALRWGSAAVCRSCRRCPIRRRRSITAISRAASKACAKTSSAAKACCARRSVPASSRPVVLQMVAVGEESGAVDDMMNEIGDMYRQEVEYELKTLGAADRADPDRHAGGDGADSGAGYLPADVGSGQGCDQALRSGAGQGAEIGLTGQPMGLFVNYLLLLPIY